MKVLVIGASRGIGLSLARVFSKNGHDVITAGLSGGRFLDLMDDASISRLAKEVAADCVVFNSGVTKLGLFSEADEVFKINLSCYRVAVEFSKAGCRSFLFVSSASAFGPQPGCAVYAATKAFMLSLSSSLREEGYRSTCVCPGPTLTGFPGVKKNYRAMTPDAVARIAYRGFVKNKSVVIPGWLNVFSVYVLRHLPFLRSYLKRLRLGEK